MDVIKYMNHAKVTLIGYDSISEQKVDNIISTFCDQTHFIDFVGSKENSLALMRDLKLLYLMSACGHVVVETENLIKDDMIILYQFLRCHDLPFKVIIKNRIFMSMGSFGGAMVKYKGGEQILYQAQFAFNIIDNNIKVVKNNIYSYLPKNWDKKEYEYNDTE